MIGALSCLMFAETLIRWSFIKHKFIHSFILCVSPSLSLFIAHRHTYMSSVPPAVANFKLSDEEKKNLDDIMHLATEAIRLVQTADFKNTYDTMDASLKTIPRVSMYRRALDDIKDNVFGSKIAYEIMLTDGVTDTIKLAAIVYATKTLKDADAKIIATALHLLTGVKYHVPEPKYNKLVATVRTSVRAATMVVSLSNAQLIALLC